MADTDIIISKKIYFIRGQKVMLDFDLAELYEVPTKVLNQAMKRNIDRFPDDFSFILTSKDETNLKSQIVTSSFTPQHGGKRKKTRVFTEHGVTMLSSVLKSKRAVHINIQILRVFVKLRELLLSHQDLSLKLEKLEEKYDTQFKVVFQALRRMLEEEEKPKEKMGFRTN